MEHERERVILIDGSGYIFRAYFAIQRLSTSRGMPTNAVFGFVNMLSKVLEVEKPTRLAIAFDTGKATFRKEIYPEYKSNRMKPPEDLVAQIPWIQRAVDCFGIHRVEAPGFEADDVIGTLARRAVESGLDVEIITGDKDLMQLVAPHITLFETMKDRRIDAAGVVDKFGVEPSQVIDFLALMGDTSDNIPGVSGIGEKTAAKLLQQFGSLDGIYQNLEAVKQQKCREALVAEKDLAYLSQRLATVRCDLPIELNWQALEYRGPRREELRALFQELEFQQLLKRFELEEPAPPPAAAASHYEVIRTEERLERLLRELSGSQMVAVDTETTSLNPQDAELVGISLCGEAGKAVYLPLGHRDPLDPQRLVDGQLPVAGARRLLKPFLEDPKIAKAGQNLKYDIQIFRRWGVELRGIAADTLLESYLLDPDEPHNLDSLAQRHLGHRNIKYEEVTGSGKSQISFAEVPVERAAEYSGEDADVALQLHQKLGPQLTGDLETLYRQVEVPLVEVLADMEYCGVLVDAGRLREMSRDLDHDLSLTEAEVFRQAGETFNINSPKQLSKILFEKLKLPVVKKTKTGISTDERVLQQLSIEHEICQWIVKYRELGKLKSTYVEGLLAQIHPVTHRVHTNYNQTVAATGRLSSSNPNLQNIPVGSDRYDVRAVFVAPEGSELLSADYSQVELRLLADMSGDPELLRAFRNDEDVHEYTGRLIFGTEKVTAEQRRIAKTINFGVVYGQTPFGLSQTLRISPKDAKAFIDTYFARYAGVQAFMRQLVTTARDAGCATTALGRRRFLPEIRSQNRMRREMAERAAINTPLQGTAADMIKKAMVSIQRRLHREHLKTRMILQVHDELVFEVPRGERSQIEALVRAEMEGALALKVPLKVDVGWGKNWRETD
jgi:DNA polymerase-1